MLERLGIMPAAASTQAGRVDALYFFLVAVAVFFAALIASLIVVFAVRYRRRSDAEVPPPIKGSLALELTWTIVPFLISMVIFVWATDVFIALRTPPKNALDVFVVGRQWMWKVQHLEGRREINELHVPVGRPIKLNLTAEDVIHSFFVPAFRIKEDAVPGRYTEAWFEATTPGTYHLFCAEYCGTEHSHMIGRIVVLEPADFQAWLAGAGDGNGAGGVLPVATSGQAMFERLGCVTCHNSGSGALGPSLAGVFGSTVHLQSGGTLTADENYLRESILNPQAKIVAGYQPVMPTFKGQVNEEDLLQLITYIKTLQATAPPDQANGAGAGAQRGS